MNLDEKRYCLLCGRVIHRNQQVAVIANVLLAHQQCVSGGER